LLLTKQWLHNEQKDMSLAISQLATEINKKVALVTKGPGSSFGGKATKGGKKVWGCKTCIEDGKWTSQPPECGVHIISKQEGSKTGSWHVDENSIFAHKKGCMGVSNPTAAEIKVILSAGVSEVVHIDGEHAKGMLTKQGINVSTNAAVRQVHRITAKINGIDKETDEKDYNLIDHFCKNVRENMQRISRCPTYSITNTTSLLVAPPTTLSLSSISSWWTTLAPVPPTEPISNRNLSTCSLLWGRSSTCSPRWVWASSFWTERT